ncbi:Trichosetin biosynthesis cluster transcription factor TF22 [Fusarium oxysporum f. sp. albedinis]|nr:Trichosetin biosynthesis cluster transcription factor TF22 [Fusarium oxysporum f. sp. albedinis]
MAFIGVQKSISIFAMVQGRIDRSDRTGVLAGQNNITRKGKREKKSWWANDNYPPVAFPAVAPVALRTPPSFRFLAAFWIIHFE